MRCDRFIYTLGASEQQAEGAGGMMPVAGSMQIANDCMWWWYIGRWYRSSYIVIS